MAKNVFISFRYRDGHKYKDEIASLFDESIDTVDFSEDENRSNLSETTIQNYLYGKLKRSSVTILILTPEAVRHQKDGLGRYSDLIYDELRYSLEDRGNNRTNGLIAVYTPETEGMVCEKKSGGPTIVYDFDNLARKNMMNVKPAYKKNKEPDIYDRYYDSYCSLVSLDEFKSDFVNLIDIASWKRDNQDHYNILKRL